MVRKLVWSNRMLFPIYEFDDSFFRSIVLFRNSDTVTVDDHNMHGSFTAESVLIDSFFYMIEQLDWQKDRDNYALVFDSSSWTISLYNADGTKD